MGQEVVPELEINENWPDDSSVAERLAVIPVESSGSSLDVSGGLMGGRSDGSVMKGLFTNHELEKDGNDFFGSTSGGGRSSKGLAGLQNLGNTCFMNSALQCLAHTPELVDYFLEDYTTEINRANPLGMEGELAVEFGELLRKLWTSGKGTVAPRTFKGKLSRFAPQFSGYNQHDSQELLAFLLDGLHEDLNRVKSKPYIEVKEIDGRPDAEVADEYWANHRARNDSIIVDLFQGQYKSTLVCPSCNKVSVTFDPFMYLSLPLPAKPQMVNMTITVFSGGGSTPPTPYTVQVPRHGRCKDLSQAIGNACKLHEDEWLMLVEIYNNRIFRVLSDSSTLISFQDGDRLAAFRLRKLSEKAPMLILFHGLVDETSLCPGLARKWRLFGSPFITYLPEEGLTTGAELYTIVKRTVGVMKRHSEGVREDRSKSYACKAEDSLEGEPFHLYMTDEKASTAGVRIDPDMPLPSAFNSSREPRERYITLEWSEKALQQYDIRTLDMLPEVSKAEGSLDSKRLRQEPVSLYACLETFIKEEPLGPDDMWFCPRCKEHRQASKKLDLWRLPEILVVHLKRFSYSRYSKNKLESLVDFPIHDLDLNKYVSRKTDLYELYAVSNHYGGMGGGHYTAYAKLCDESKWYNFDDSHVSAVSSDDIKTSAAYVLFYRRKRNRGHGEVAAQSSLTDGVSSLGMA